MLAPVPILAALLQFAPPSGAGRPLGDGPLDFRCKEMRILTKPNRTFCQDDVVVRRDNLLVCCKTWEGYAAGDWGWERFVCKEDVRAQRGDEMMWAQRAEFVVATSELTLTGEPRLHRGKSMLVGESIVVDVKNDRARVRKPRGRLESIEAKILAVKELPREGPLPQRCPLPPLPTR